MSTPAGPELALTEPVEPPPARWTGALCLASLGLTTAWYGPLQVLLALQATAVVGEEGKEAALAVVVGLGAAFSMLANPVFGALSDRTSSRFGRRLPWVVFGALGGAASLGLLAVAESLAVMAIAWCAAQTTLNALFAALVAAVPDQVPRTRRGLVGGWLGMAQTVGIVAGTGLAAAAGGITAGYLACAAFLLVAVVPYLLLRRDTVLPASARPAWSTRRFVAGFWVDPRRHPDFGWAWLTRFLINLGNAIGIVYLLFYLADHVGYADPAAGVFQLTLVYATTVVLTVVGAGAWSDRLGRRKVFVTASAVIIALAVAILVAFPAWPAPVVAAVVLGAGYGVYTSVDFALLTEVLPAAADRGKDLGVVNIANSLPQVLAPVIAAPVVTHLGGYPVLYAVAAAFALLGGVLVGRIRSV
ncbi:MFS transporter, partial [Pseudonocardia nigra]|uniref:MFS transporter n=1 Tax=Pseudonocardia nigra TaxID=1921578 RepID=UPI001C5DE5C4